MKPAWPGSSKSSPTSWADRPSSAGEPVDGVAGDLLDHRILVEAVAPVGGPGVEHLALAFREGAHDGVTVSDAGDVLGRRGPEETGRHSFEIPGRVDTCPQRRRCLAHTVVDGDEACGRS